jgi:Mn2+/Fe2+ NRAMP family transporter
MQQKQFSMVAGAIFAVVALVHLLRIYMGWTVMIGDWTAPVWMSWIAVIGAAVLSFAGLRSAARR